MQYQKSQISWIANGVFALMVLSLYLIYITQWGTNPLPLAPFLIMLGVFIVLWLFFFRLTVKFNGSILQVIYGIGLITIKLKIDDLVSTKVIRTPWYYGLGIRITPGGMLYNIQGTKAVEIKYISNNKSKSVMIGSPEPERLKSVLDESFRKR